MPNDDARAGRPARPPAPPPPAVPLERGTLGDGRVLLRPYAEADAEALAGAARESTAEVFPWLPWCHALYSRADAAAFIARAAVAWHGGEEYNFAVTDARSARFLAGAGINQLSREYPFANLGYWVRTSAARQGVATVAARLVARFGCQVLGLERVEIVVAVGNEASLRVAAKAGARREGVLRSRLVLHGSPVDAVMHSFVPADFPADTSGGPAA